MANEEELRSFGRVIQHLEDGQLHADLSDKLHALNLALIKHAEQNGKAKGEITLKIKLSADSGGTVQIDSDFKVKEPPPVRARSVTWVNKEGHLATSNPKQTKLPLREVPRQQAARDLDHETAAPRGV